MGIVSERQFGNSENAFILHMHLKFHDIFETLKPMRSLPLQNVKKVEHLQMSDVAAKSYREREREERRIGGGLSWARVGSLESRRI